jgi:xylose isomerase
MKNKLAIISAFLGAAKNRYMTYQEDRCVKERLDMAAAVKDIAGVELCYPQDFEDPELLKKCLEKNSLEVSAINFRSRRSGVWLRGSFSSQIENERYEVVQDLKRAMVFAAELGCYRVSTCPLNDGHDYLFEMDYTYALDCFEETLAEAARSRPDVRIAIEYKWNDPRARCLLGNAGETLAFCNRLGMENVGVTLDIGHAIQAGERPAQSACMLARDKRLFYVHLNDNDKLWDYDMIPGAYNFCDFIEFLYYLKQLGYSDYFAYDVFPKEINAIENFNAVTYVTRLLCSLVERLDKNEVSKLLALRNPARSIIYVYKTLFPDVHA